MLLGKQRTVLRRTWLWARHMDPCPFPSLAAYASAREDEGRTNALYLAIAKPSQMGSKRTESTEWSVRGLPLGLTITPHI
jgi:hypothetical protein